jgi:uncharacterized damage-inducible protein DinB
MRGPAAPLQTTFALNSALFGYVLAGIDDREARQSIGATAHRIDHIAAHLLDARAFLARTLGLRPEFPVLAVVAAANSFAELGDRAPLSELREAWNAISPDLTDAVARVDGAKTETAAFLLQHEAYHLGQIGLLRRELGLLAARYPAAPNG